MDHGASFFRVTFLGIAACLVAWMGNLPALGPKDPPFAYDFGSAKHPSGFQDSNRSDIAFAIFPNGNTASMPDSMPQQIDRRDAPGVAFAYETPVDDSLLPLSLPQISEPIVPEPSTILGGIAAAGLMLAFLMRRWRHNRSSTAGG